MTRIYLDAAPVIYLIENVSPYADKLIERLAGPGVIQLCSDLTRLECRLKPLRDGNPTLLAAFDRYFGDIITTVLPLSSQVIDRATFIRAKYGFRVPDAVHLAAAMAANCDSFLTTDSRLARFPEIKVDVIGAQ